MTVSVEWEIKGTEFANCNCSYGCPCQFNASPHIWHCRALPDSKLNRAALAT